jgi:hypothetical protein
MRKLSKREEELVLIRTGDVTFNVCVFRNNTAGGGDGAVWISNAADFVSDPGTQVQLQLRYL